MDIKKGFLDFIHDFEHNEQKRTLFLVVFIIFVGVCSVFVGFYNTKNNIKAPYINKEQQDIEHLYNTYDKLKREGKLVEDTTTNNQVSQNQNTSGAYSGYPSKTIDTDSDGLSDYDEVNIFHTSAFLIDSDGDGVNDYNEVNGGTDPNCPIGKVCSSSNTTSNSENTNENTKSINNEGIKINGVDVNNMDVSKARQELNNIVPDNLKPMLSKMTDDQIKSLMQQLYSSSTTQTSTDASSSSASTNVTQGNNSTDYVSLLRSKLPKFNTSQIATIKSMSEADIKKLLLDSNIADDNLLSKFKTGELKTTVVGE